MATTTTKESTMTTTTKTSKSNKYAAPCNACGATVPAGTGILAGRMVGTGRWLVRHNTAACTPPAAMPVNRPVRQWAASGPVRSLVLNQLERPYGHGYIGRTWAEVLEANEYFDGEPELTAAAHSDWVLANVEANLSATEARYYRR